MLLLLLLPLLPLLLLMLLLVMLLLKIVPVGRFFERPYANFLADPSLALGLGDRRGCNPTSHWPSTQPRENQQESLAEHIARPRRPVLWRLLRMDACGAGLHAPGPI